MSKECPYALGIARMMEVAILEHRKQWGGAAPQFFKMHPASYQALRRETPLGLKLGSAIPSDAPVFQGVRIIVSRVAPSLQICTAGNRLVEV